MDSNSIKFDLFCFVVGIFLIPLSKRLTIYLVNFFKSYFRMNLKSILNVDDYLTELEEELLKQNEALTNELSLLREQIDYLTKKIFGRFSEQSKDDKNQIDLFDDDSSFNLAETTEEKTVFEEISYKRKKKKGCKDVQKSLLSTCL